MSGELRECLRHLEALVAFDTRNPPRAIGAGGIFDYLRSALPGFEFRHSDHGDGCHSLLATRGRPRGLYNFHIDTVPAGSAWDTDPLRLRVTADRAYGLGACDIKGAAACMLTAAGITEGDLALLFTSDEEAGQSRCVRSFLAEPQEFTYAVVAEPTCAQAVTAHRGIATAAATFAGVPGHGASPRALEDNAIHRAVRWAGHALEFAEQRGAQCYGPLQGIRLNLGVIEGGVKPNVIAPRAQLRFGIRPLPGQDGQRLLQQLRDLAPASHLAEWQPGFLGPALPSPDQESAQASVDLARELGLDPGDPVDFWTEASLFAEAGLAAIVYGPGDIAQAHTANEWVELAQLAQVTRTYARLSTS
jgi:acetylornithine deacetylase